MIPRPSRSCQMLFSRILVCSMVIAGLAESGPSVEAAGLNVPWECSNYTDEAQTRCLNAFIERQQEQIGRLEGRLQAQQELLGQLKGQVDRQTTATAQLQQQLSQPPAAPAMVAPPYLYPSPYAYPAFPPVGLGLYFGQSWRFPGFYGYYGRPYWGPGFFYRHHGRHW